MPKRLIQIFVVVLLLVNTAVLCVLWWSKKDAGQPGKPPPPAEYIMKELGLNNRQVEQYKRLRDQHHGLIMRLNGESRKWKEQLFSNIASPVADTALINTVARHVSDIESEKDKTTLYHFRDLRRILSEPQKKKLDNIIVEVLRMMARPDPPLREPQDR